MLGFVPFDTSGWPALVRFPLALVLLVALIGCVSSRSPEEVASERAEVLGTWEYQTEGINILQRGTLRITEENGDLIGRFRDSWRGKLDVEIALQGSHMEFTLDDYRVSGQLTNGEFTASIRRPLWDVSRSHPDPQPVGYFEARRLQREAAQNEFTDLGCHSLLRESSFTCSPVPHL